MAAGTQQTATLGTNNANGDGQGAGQNGGTGEGAGTGNGNEANVNNSNDPSGNGTGNGDAGNGTDNDGSGNGAGVSGAGDFGFDGEFNAERARTLINTLREESKGKDSIIREMRERLEKLEKAGEGGNGQSGTKNDNDGSSTDNAALEEIRKIRNELAEEKRLTRFQNLANGIHPDAVAMAYSAVRDEFDIDSNGVVTNMTSVIESLKQHQPFLFAPVTNGQNQAGSAGGGTNTAGNGKLYTEDEKAAMRAFNMTPEQFEAAKTGKPPVK